MTGRLKGITSTIGKNQKYIYCNLHNLYVRSISCNRCFSEQREIPLMNTVFTNKQDMLCAVCSRALATLKPWYHHMATS